MEKVFFNIFFFLALPNLIFPLELPQDDAKIKTEIVNLLQMWSENFNNKNILEVCQLFAPDLIASYPGVSDKNYQEMCQKLSVALSDPEKTFRYLPPKIEQVIIEKDIAIVRLIWTLDALYHFQNRQLIERIEEKGLDVFRRQKDGRWKIAISYAYPLS